MAEDFNNNSSPSLTPTAQNFSFLPQEVAGTTGDRREACCSGPGPKGCEAMLSECGEGGTSEQLNEHTTDQVRKQSASRDGVAVVEVLGENCGKVNE